MVAVSDLDLCPIEDFSLKWRWTDERWNLLPTKFIQQINPLTDTKAKEVDEIHKQYFSSHELNEKFFEKVETIQAETSDFSVVQNWLESKIKAEQNYIAVCWGKDLAVKTTSEIFCNYWDDFCYPTSDDVSISPLNLSWLLFYSHSEYFVFGKIKEEFLRLNVKNV